MGNSLVLLPTYNEIENLPRIVPRLAALERTVDVLVIDDSSPDGTGELADELARTYSRLSVLHRKRKEGLGRAYVYGFGEALLRGYRAVVTMDADLSHAPEDVPRLLSALEEADIAVGSRHAAGGGVEGWPFSRHLLSRAGSLYARTLLGLGVSDVTSGFRAYRAEALSEIDLELVRSKGFVFQIEILRRLLDLPGARAIEVPIRFKNRTHGTSKLSRRIVVEATGEVAELALRRRQVPKRRYEPLEEEPRQAPLVSVVVAARSGAPDPESLRSLPGLDYPQRKLEVLLARGENPSRQRNEAARASRGKHLLFLDDDSEVSAELLSRHVRALESDPTLGAVGGPALSKPGNAFQNLASAIIAEAWVLGRTASRYRARGEARFTDERELILCNLCVRREAFEELGGFNETLYPNEENEFLERMRRRGWRMLYRPDALVRRPQRRNLAEHLETIYRYGAGRSAQLRCLASRSSVERFALVALALLSLASAAVGAVLGSAILLVPLLLYVGYCSALTLKFALSLGVARGVCAAGLAPLTHAAYLAGALRGIVRSSRERTQTVTLERHPAGSRWG